MRIISGYFRGKKIAEPNSKNTRPLKDLTKESIFNIIQHNKFIKIKIEWEKIFHRNKIKGGEVKPFWCWGSAKKIQGEKS